MVGAQLQGQQALQKGQAALSGSLRLSVPPDFGGNVLQTWVDDFHTCTQGSLHLKMSDRAADLIRQPLDAVVRYGALRDSWLLALTLAGDNRRAHRAAPSYIEQHGAPGRPEDLRRNNCLRDVCSDQIHERWHFTSRW
jgi:DNA-binding transcriptional LysR family regulator